MPKKIKDKVIDIYRKQYVGFGPLLASGETFRDRRHTGTGRDLKKVANRIRGLEENEERQEASAVEAPETSFWEMIQIDGSHHDWFEGRGPECVLIGYIDDATGKAFGRFYDYEGTMPAFDSFKRYARKYGIPQKAYLDKHTTYKSPGKPSLKDDTEPLSQFQGAMKELGVEVIHAHSPQAKGRIERLFRDLSGQSSKRDEIKGYKDRRRGKQVFN